MRITKKSLYALTAISSVAVSAVICTQASANQGEPQQCATPYPDNGVAEATIVYQIDKVIAPGEFFLPMPDERNTQAYRERAFDFFLEQFGVVLEPTGFTPQPVLDGLGGSAFATAFQLSPGTSQQVIAIDSQEIPQFSGRFPLNDVAMIDDGYAVIAGEDGFTVFGAYGGPDGVWLPPNTVLIFGEYVMIDGAGDIIDVLEYRSRIPAFQTPLPGAANPTLSVSIRCDIRSALFGEGNTHGLGTSTILPDGSTDLETRYIMRFPSRIADSDLDGAKCDNVKALSAAQYDRYAD